MTTYNESDASSLSCTPDKKSVHFDERCRVRRITHLSNMSKETILSIWYFRDEMKSFKEDCKDEIRTLVKKKEFQRASFYDTKTCPRGLETFHPKRSRTRLCRRRDVWEAVLGEQEVQYELGSVDSDFLAKVCSNVTGKSVQNALEQADMDEQALAEASEEFVDEPAKTIDEPPPKELAVQNSGISLPLSRSPRRLHWAPVNSITRVAR